MSKPNRGPQFMMLFCFVIAGLWAGSIGTYIATENSGLQTADVELTQEAAGRFFDRKEGGDTEPYVQGTAPPLGKQAPLPEGIVFPTPDVPDTAPLPISPGTATPPVFSPPIAVTPPDAAVGEENPITAALGSLQKLFAGEGDFSDIMKVAMAAFAAFGGAQLGGSDILFKTILGLFSKKSNFNAILEDKLLVTGSRRARRRAARK